MGCLIKKWWFNEIQYVNFYIWRYTGATQMTDWEFNAKELSLQLDQPDLWLNWDSSQIITLYTTVSQVTLSPSLKVPFLHALIFGVGVLFANLSV